MPRQFRLGLLINPFAGIGGAVALKGSDGHEIRQQALALGASKQANTKAALALSEFIPLQSQIDVFTANGEMGADIASQLGFNVNEVYQSQNAETQASDSQALVKALLAQDIDLLLFAGGDGTARDIVDLVQDTVPVLGIPAGCKIHSGVYAVTPASAGRVVTKLIQGEIVSLLEGEVKDLDEDLFRQGLVKPRWYGQMNVPQELTYIQAVKMGGRESDELVLADISAYIEELIEEHAEMSVIMGSGSTVDAICQSMGLPNTLLGVDVVKGDGVVMSDVTANQLEIYSRENPCLLVITLIGGQGHIFGRGNQQLSPEVLRNIGRENILIVASKSKLHGLQGKPLIADTGDVALDKELSGNISIIAGYKDKVLYPIANLEG